MAFIQIPLDIITATNITNAEKIVVAALLNFRWKDTNITYIGNYKLAEFLHTSRQAIIRALKNLEEKQYIIINPRKNGSQSNEILLTIERGIEFALEGMQKPLEGYQIDTPKGTQNDTPEGYQNDTPEGYQNDTPEGYQNDTPETQIGTPGYQNDTPHKDIIFKYPDLNLKTREEGNQNDTPRVHSNYIAPADVAAGLSKPSQQAGEGLAKEVCAEAEQLDIDDLCLWQGFVAAYPRRYPWFQLVRVKNQLLLRGIGKMGDSMLTAAWDDVSGWFALRGRHVAKAETNKRFNGEIIVGR